MKFTIQINHDIYLSNNIKSTDFKFSKIVMISKSRKQKKKKFTASGINFFKKILLSNYICCASLIGLGINLMSTGTEKGIPKCTGPTQLFGNPIPILTAPFGSWLLAQRFTLHAFFLLVKNCMTPSHGSHFETIVKLLYFLIKFYRFLINYYHL